MEDWNEGDVQSCLLNLLQDAWVERVTKEEAKRAKNNHTVKMILGKKQNRRLVHWTRGKATRDFKRQSLRNALLITVSGDRETAAIWRLDENEVGSQTIRLQAVPARMTCDNVLEWVGEEVLKEYKNPHNRGLQAGDRSVRQVGAGSDGEAVMDPAEAEGGKGLGDDDDEDEPAETAVCAFVAYNLHKGSNQGSWPPLQQVWKKGEKKEPRRVGDPPLSFGEFIRAHPQGCFGCCGRSARFHHEYRTCPIHKVDTEAYKKALRTKKRTPANIQEAKVEVSKDELSKLMMVGTDLTKEIQEIKTAWGPKPIKDKDKDKDKKGRGRGNKKGDAVKGVAAEEDTPTTDPPSWSPCSQGPQPGQSEDGAAVNSAPSLSGILDFPGGVPSRMPGARAGLNNSRNGWMRANAGRITALGGPTCPTKVTGEGTNSCTQSSFATKNVFDVLQDLSESIGGSPGPQLDAADGLSEPNTHDLHQSLIELLERPENLSLHAVRQVGRELQLHLKIRALCREVERVFNVLVDTGAQVSLVKAGLLPPECLTASWRPIRLKSANGQYMVGGTKEAEIELQFVNHRELSHPDLGKEILLKGKFYEALMDSDMIVGYNFIMDTDSGVLPAQASMTLYEDDQRSLLLSPDHHVE